MAFKIFIMILVISIFTFFIYSEIIADKQIDVFIKSQINEAKNESIPKFSVSSYLQRVQDLSDELQHEKEQSTNYRIVLWWGIDGLTLNADGSYKWIKKEIIKFTTLTSPAGAWYESMVQQICCTSQYQRFDSMLQCQQSRIDELQMQNTMLQLQCAQQQQMQNMIDTIHPQMVSNQNFLLGGYYGKCS